MRATRAVIHLDGLRRNIGIVRERIGPGPLICMPLKADAYGHGAVAVGKAALAAGVASLAVAALEEGAELREAGITAPVLLLSAPLPGEMQEAVSLGLTPLVWDRECAALLNAAAEKAGAVIPVHIKVDTGMGRIGCRSGEAADLARCLSGLKALRYAGTATHLAAADSPAGDDVRYTAGQLALFDEALRAVRAAGFDPGLVHAANSGAVAFHRDAWFGMVRPGLLLYGYEPSPEAGLPVRPVMELITQITFIKRVKKGEAVSYGRTWTAPKDTVIATIPAGYGDGLPRALSGRHSALIRGKAYPLVGRICMDQSMIDLGPHTDIERWEQVTLFGGDAPGADDVAAKLQTIPYEITCGINKRVPRIYSETPCPPG